MKKFLYKLSFFIIVIAIGVAGLEVFYRFVPNNYTEKRDMIKKNYDAQIISFGNSHTFYGINPDYFIKKTLNLSNISQSILYDKLIFDQHLERFKELKYITVNIEYSSLSQKDNLPELEWRKYFYESQMNIKTGKVSSFDIRKYIISLAPRFKLSLSSVEQYISEGSLVECEPNGWAKLKGVNKKYNNPEIGKYIALKHEDNSLDFTENVNRIQKIINECKERDIKVVLITMPVTSYYSDNVDKEKLNLIFEQATQLAKDNSNVKYINLFSDKRFNNSDFYDADHLNSGGAKKCSKIVNDFIELSR